jgi:RimJ/RimL family protein N-acetyltransferase
MTSRTIVLRTARTQLTTWLPSDRPDLRRLQTDPDVVRHQLVRSETAEETRSRLERYLRDQAGRGWTRWRVQDATGAMIGRAGFELGEDGEHRELGYAYVPEVWGAGVATEVAVALAHDHDTSPDPACPPELHAYAFEANTASRRVLEKVGFVARGLRPHRGEECVLFVRD